ncbi:hypothetical protein DOY81_000775, partial [Sarcophaga bullata]
IFISYGLASLNSSSTFAGFRETITTTLQVNKSSRSATIQYNVKLNGQSTL